MSFWYGNATEERPTSVGAGQAPLDEVWNAARDQQKFVDNSDSSFQALYRSYDDRIKAIRERTGETRENPLLLASRGSSQPPRPRGSRANQVYTGVSSRSTAGTEIQAFNDWLAQVAARHPDAADVIKADVPMERDAEALARHSEERLAKAMASQEGAAKWGAVIAGGMQGSLYDPLQVLTLFAGGGAGGAKTAIGRIGKVALQETAINGLSEAMLQPEVQAWRKQAGLPNGWGEAMQNIGFAALAGGVLGTGLTAAGEAAARLFRGANLDAASREIAKAPTVRPDVAEGLQGNGLAAIDALKPIRDRLPAEVRGAIDQADMIARDAAVKPIAASVPHHELMTDRATRAALSSQPFMPEADPEQIARVVEQLMPSVDGAAPAERTLQQFLSASGGVKDFKGELEALGLTNASERFVGKLVKPDGMPLDQARRAAAEAGYFNHLYGTAENAMEKSTVNDLLEALDTGARSEIRVRGADGERAYVESLVSDIAARAGPAVDDDLIVRATELANAENLDPAEALDRVLIEHDRLARQQEDQVATIEPAKIEGMVRVYHSGAMGEGETGRWVSTSRAYASGYRSDLPLFYLDLPATDRRVNNPDIPEQGVAQGFTFNFETTPKEAAQLREISREAAPAARPADLADRTGGLSDPAAIDDDALFTAADLEGLPDDYDIPFFDDGRTLTGAELMAELDHHENLFQLVEACRA